jgi:pyruvate formate lyase activating enzyme
MTNIPATTLTKLTEARQIAQSAGLLHVYTGNVQDQIGGTTYCSQCKQPLIVRDRYHILEYAFTEGGNCSHCGTKLAGHFDKFEGEFGGRRIPLRINNR